MWRLFRIHGVPSALNRSARNVPAWIHVNHVDACPIGRLPAGEIETIVADNGSGERRTAARQGGAGQRQGPRSRERS